MKPGAVITDTVNGQKTLSREGVFKGFNGLEGLAEAQSFWDQQPYGTRLYYGEGGFDYLHRDVLRSAIKALINAGQFLSKCDTEQQLAELSSSQSSTQQVPS